MERPKARCKRCVVFGQAGEVELGGKRAGGWQAGDDGALAVGDSILVLRVGIGVVGRPGTAAPSGS